MHNKRNRSILRVLVLRYNGSCFPPDVSTFTLSKGIVFLHHLQISLPLQRGDAQGRGPHPRRQLGRRDAHVTHRRDVTSASLQVARAPARRVRRLRHGSVQPISGQRCVSLRFASFYAFCCISLGLAAFLSVLLRFSASV